MFGQIGAGQAGGLPCDEAEVDVRGERLVPGMDAEDRLAAGQIGRRDVHLPVEASGTQQRRIQILQPVRGAHHDHLVALAEAVQLDEQLVERLVVLAVQAAAHSLRADRVELVDEDDGRRIVPRLLEELANPCGTQAGEHLDEGGRARRVEVRP